MGRYYQAIESYEMALTINGKFGSALYNKGNAYASLGIITRAIDCYKRAITINKKDTYALYNLASSYEQMGRSKEAIEYFTRVVQLDPSHYESYFGRGNCFYALEDYTKSLRDYDSALKLFGDNAELWYAKADAEYNLGKVTESISSYLRVIELDPSNFNAMLDMCNTLIENEEYDRADIYLKRLLHVKPDWCEPYYSMAKVCFLKGDIEVGIAMIERAFDLSPQDRFCYDFEKDWRKILNFLIERQA